ncbi:hypothetical protein D6777_02505 [Candidatus Woesearchaeota archaeon]|nr:MAG: hypothetical protein D6777_02505 [Candidatus Woesearchaeota archaeon]
MTKKKFKIKGMVCKSCERLLEKEISKIEGVNSVDINYGSETAKVSYDDSLDFNKIKDIIESHNYYVEDINKEKSLMPLILGVILAIFFFWYIYSNIEMPQISQNMGYGLLFLVGLLTGFHCVSMCGGFVVSYSADKNNKDKPYKLHLSYATGKIISYTVIGAIFGFLGSVIAFTPMMRGVSGILAGLFLIIFGLKMLNIIPSLRKFNLKLPSSLERFIAKHSISNKKKPMVIGLLNGLMIACGPLQAIYIMAAGTGSMLEGAKMLFIFALGTLPVMLGFGHLTSILSKKSTHKILKLSGVVVILLGLIMVNRGMALTGTGYDLNSLTSSDNSATNTIINNEYQTIKMDVTNAGWVPNKFVLKKGVPVKWEINGKQINGCNNAIQVPKLGLNFNIHPGKQVIEFTPTESGNIAWSCWMGMIPGLFIVKDEVEGTEDLSQVSLPSGSCGGSCGNPTCGGGCGCGR